MQSVRQYRNLKKSVQLQVARNKAGTSSNTSSPCKGEPMPDAPTIQPRVLPEKSVEGIESGRPGFLMVSFEGPDDENNPRNWTRSRKVQATVLALGAGIVGGWASANDSTIISQARATFGVSAVVESLSTGVYLIAFGVGSLVSGPFSETVGRNPVYISTLVLFMVFIAAAGGAPNIESQLVFRFFAGLFGCTAVTTFAGTVADLWAPAERALVFTFASAANFCCVFLSAMVGAFIGQDTRMSWRWTEWLALLLTAVTTALIFLFAPETYGPVILSWKAAILRRDTGNSQHRSELKINLEPLLVRLWRSTRRPFAMLFTEISVVLFTVYLTVLYIITFTFLTGYPFIYGDVYHMSQGSIGLCFLGLDVGILLAAAMAVPLHRKHIHKLAVAQVNGLQLPPEDRLWFAIITAPFLPVGLFWMAWTVSPTISYWSSLGGSVFVGIPFLGIFVSSYLYMIDSFEGLAASALSITTFVRYVAAGAMIPTSIPMYERMGIHWTLTMLGCFSVVLTPVPIIMWKYGSEIRKTVRGKR